MLTRSYHPRYSVKIHFRNQTKHHIVIDNAIIVGLGKYIKYEIYKKVTTVINAWNFKNKCSHFNVKHLLVRLGSKIDPLAVAANDMKIAYAVIPPLRHLSWLPYMCILCLLHVYSYYFSPYFFLLIRNNNIILNVSH